MKKRGFILVEMLIVIGIVGTLVGIGGVSIKKQAESSAMLKVTNEIGDFFRVAAKRSQETGKRYGVNFDLVGENIEIYREEKDEDGDGIGDGEWEDGGIKTTIETLELPNVFEYGIKKSGSYPIEFNTNITSNGNISNNFTLYIVKSNSNSKIQGGEEVKYAISFYSGDKHVKYLHVREYLTVNSFTIGSITKSPSANKDLKLIRY